MTAERRASLRETIGMTKGAIRFALEQRERALYNNDMFMFPWERAAFLVSILKPAELRRRINIYSSFLYGCSIFDQVFPKYDNPDPFHSTEAAVCLDDNPIQVMGWAEQEELVQQGVKEGFQEDWIIVGFEERAGERGIDLEWHFSEHPTEKPTSLIQELEERPQPGRSLPAPTNS